MLKQDCLTPAFVLHTRPYRETSVLVDFFTQDFGRLTAIVRGVRKTRSSQAGLLLPFSPLCASFRGKTELLNVLRVESTGTYYFLQNRALFYGLYTNELLYRLLHRYDPYPILYTSYQELLKGLQALSGNLTRQQWALYLFIKKLLQEIGYGVQWDKTAMGDSIDASAYYSFEFGVGFSIVGQQQEGWRYQKFMGKSLLVLHNESYGDEENIPNPRVEELKEIGCIFNIIFRYLLGDKFLLCQRIFGV